MSKCVNFFSLFLYLTRAIENSAKFSKVKSIIFFLCNQYGFKILGRGNSSVLRFTKHYHKYYVSISVNVLVCYGLFKICSNGPSSFLAKQRNENLNISFLASNLPEGGFHIFLCYLRSLHSLSPKTDRCVPVSTFKILKKME